MSEELIVAQCSPTMAGLKTGTLFTCPKEDKKSLTESIRSINQRFVCKGIRMIPVKIVKNRILVYMYRPERLARDLQEPIAVKILKSKNYPVEDCNRCVIELVRRLNMDDVFPHEIGLFLGYPSEDVEGFICNGAKNAKCVGTWKVYGDENAAKRKFEQYKQCTKAYCENYRRYNSMEHLVVSC